MRQLLLWAPEGQGSRIEEAARRHNARDVLRLAADRAGERQDVVLVELPNIDVDPLMDDVSGIEGLHVSFFPRSTLTFEPPPERPPEHLVDVTGRSALEIFVAGLQSVGSWRGFLAYAAISGAVAWMGLYTGSIFLLTAAMLIAPFAEPAMTAAMATARGDRRVLQASLRRYGAAIGTAIVPPALLTLLFGLEGPTRLMVEAAELSTAAVVLPLAAGAAGAVNLGQSERTSLVSSAAAGMLVAAALAPPVGVIGMSVVIASWPLAAAAAWVLALQLVGINLSGAFVFWLSGLRSQGARYRRGRRGTQRLAATATVVALGALLAVQFVVRPQLTRQTVARRAEAVARQVAGPGFLEAQARFLPATGEGQESLLVVVHATAADADLAGRVAQRLGRLFPEVRSYVSVNEASATR